MALSEDQMKAMHKKREKILQEATMLFAVHGYNDTTIAKVANAAGISFGSVFTYFASKEELFYATIKEPLEKLGEELLSFDSNAVNPMKEIEALVQKHVLLISQQPVYLRLFQQVLGQPERFKREFEILNQFFQLFQNKMGILIKRGQELGQLRILHVEAVAISYLSFLNGLRLTTIDGPEHDVWKLFVPCGIQLFGPVE
ncbi:TetR/AcrR family transcriptional regulator [Ectobacillus antri]|jgi:TetR/AcrR family transcriptional repressor of mexJK operon|uniref:TetR/AcrR family transcriptional regulator n=1 Tax=Ectobacillus antri TaxID=2486280 RepID=A0ABT6H5D1_9BACI|nr:TetR/AcrR family transcriptional regulator [Ectobacillus antri]MDG4657416.1 TetR/AcrR family transcriptional regulator [Ectobacillus antri]MDG5754453.1 TetR/AcrR family transcriptional regulator [Ectobacillus antri]